MNPMPNIPSHGIPGGLSGPQAKKGGAPSLTTLGLTIGQRLLGRYEVRSVLGQGSNGDVLEVFDQHTQNLYALKRIAPNVTTDARQLGRIRQNFALVAQLSHPHIGGTYFFERDEAKRMTYLVLELIKGEDLRTWIKRRRSELGAADAPLPLEQALGIAEQAARALDFAHSLPVPLGAGKIGYGILHLDVKPANLMVVHNKEDRTGVPYVKLVDFGLAQAGQAELGDRSVSGQMNLRMGTPLYMAPEQWTGSTLTRGADQWSLAVILYEMLAGRRPFTGRSEMELLHDIQAADPPPPAGLNSRQWAALKKTLVVDRKQRHRSCMALVKALADADTRTAGKFGLGEQALPAETEVANTLNDEDRMEATLSDHTPLPGSNAENAPPPPPPDPPAQELPPGGLAQLRAEGAAAAARSAKGGSGPSELAATYVMSAGDIKQLHQNLSQSGLQQSGGSAAAGRPAAVTPAPVARPQTKSSSSPLVALLIIGLLGLAGLGVLGGVFAFNTYKEQEIQDELKQAETTARAALNNPKADPVPALSELERVLQRYKLRSPAELATLEQLRKDLEARKAVNPTVLSPARPDAKP